MDELWASQQQKNAEKVAAELDWESAREAELVWESEQLIKKEYEEKEKEAKLMEEYHDLKWSEVGEGEKEEVETEKEQEVEENYEEEEMTQEEWMQKAADESEELVDPRWEEMGAHIEMLESEAMMKEDTAALALRQKECYLARADEFECKL